MDVLQSHISTNRAREPTVVTLLSNSHLLVLLSSNFKGSLKQVLVNLNTKKIKRLMVLGFLALETSVATSRSLLRD